MTAFLSFDDQLKPFSISLDPTHREPVVEIECGTEAIKSRADIG